MPYLQELVRQSLYVQPVGTDLGLPKGGAYSSYYPTYEVQSPQYISPNPYSLAQMGYRTNEVVYALISKRAKALSDAMIKVWNDAGDQPEEMPKHPLRRLLKKVNAGIGEKMFWQITSIYRDIAGFAAWEIERNNRGEPIRLWAMRPDWCSFLRGEQQPMRAIRYQPYGLPPADIPIENVFIAGSFDPLFPQIKFYSPTMAALESIKVDNAMTMFLQDFVSHGAKFSGLLSVAQTIDENTANDYKRRFRDAHGGTQNWSDPLVLGLGAKYESMQMNFRDMVFPELDARTESRLCMAFEMSPILISAKVGLDRSTYSNYEQANKAWYNEWVSPEWQILADSFGEQMLPHYHENTDDVYCAFDTTKVRALNEDRTTQADRATNIYKSGLAKLNEAREEMGLDPLDDELGNQFFNKPAEPQLEELTGKPKTNAEEDQAAIDQAAANAAQIAKDKELEDEEIKDFRAFAKRRIKENKHADILEFEFKYVGADRAALLVAQYAQNDNGANQILEGIKSALQALDARTIAPSAAQPINIEVHSYPTNAPIVNVEAKSADQPAPVVTVINKVEPTPVNVNNTMPATKPAKARKARMVKADDGTITIEEE